MHYSKREWKLSHAQNCVFDYNSALELDYLRFRKLNTVQEDDDESSDRQSLHRKTSLSTQEKEPSLRDHVFRVSSLRDIDMETVKSQISLPGFFKLVLPSRSPGIQNTKTKVTRTLSGQPITTIRLNPLGTYQYLSTTRRTLILESSKDRRECTVRDWRDGEIKFSCIPREDGIVCRGYGSMLDIITVGREINVTGIYRSIDGFKDGLVARIKKGPFGKVKYQIDVMTLKEKTKIITSINRKPIQKTAFVSWPGQEVSQSLTVYRKSGALKVRDEANKAPIARVRRDGESTTREPRYWLNLEPSVDCCFVSVLTIFALRKKIFGDNLPGVLRSHNGLFSNSVKKVAPS
ncbi:hypothetical protein ACHWQZ_G013426 [Mnemiopsis leidyi]